MPHVPLCFAGAAKKESLLRGYHGFGRSLRRNAPFRRAFSIVARNFTSSAFCPILPRRHSSVMERTHSVVCSRRAANSSNETRTRPSNLPSEPSAARPPIIIKLWTQIRPPAGGLMRQTTRLESCFPKTSDNLRPRRDCLSTPADRSPGFRSSYLRAFPKKLQWLCASSRSQWRGRSRFALDSRTSALFIFIFGVMIHQGTFSRQHIKYFEKMRLGVRDSEPRRKW